MMKIKDLKDNVQGMREKILDLVMRGKLVAQDENDEPASLLLEKIVREKAQLIKEKNIKKTKSLPEITDEEKPFDIPNSWEWVRLGEVVLSTIGGGTPAKNISKYWNGNLPWISIKDIHDKEYYISSSLDTITQDGLRNSSTNLIKKGSIIVAMRMAVGRISILKVDACINQDLRALNISERFDKHFLLYIYSSLNLKTSGSTVKGIKLGALLNTIIPLPPLNEQKRIAAKVEKLFALIDTIEESLTKYEDLQEELEDKVLDLAMRGKLVEQRDDEEPASALLEKVKAEKAELIKEKKIKKTKPLPEITDEEKPFAIPDSWEWVRLGDINNYFGHSVHPQENPHNIYELYSIPIFPTKKPEIVEGRDIKSNKQSVIKNDILLCKINPRINRVWKVLDLTENETIASTEWIIVRQNNIFSDYLIYNLMSPYFRKLLQSNVSGVGGSLTRAKPKEVQNYLVPIPPFREQMRISKKIQDLKGAIL